jgi:hypothetical protein
MNTRIFAVSLAGLAVLGIYLFATAPEKLPDGAPVNTVSIPVEKALRVLADQNNAARSLYTAEIVAPGQRAGLRFGERWKREDVEEGPLPALLLREVAANVRKTTIPLGLFLGSDYPISAANKFDGSQMEAFMRVKNTREPVFFPTGDHGAVTAMFPDFSAAPGCVTCHNEHPESPKKDWKLNDVMGATTWIYPKNAVPPEEFVAMVTVLRASLREAYGSYLAKAATFSKPPEIGAKWPRDGYFLPDTETFLLEFDRRGAGKALTAMLDSLKVEPPAK